MDFKQIQELIKLFSKSKLSELHIEKKDFKISLTSKEPTTSSINTNNQQTGQVAVPSQPVQVMPQQTPIQQQAVATTPAPAPSQQEKPADEPATDNLIVVRSPMIGTFYRAPGPDKEPFVKVGDIVHKGTVLCIIEAMKLFNEIESEVDGKIVKILVEDASPVEYDQPLFYIDPNI